MKFKLEEVTYLENINTKQLDLLKKGTELYLKSEEKKGAEAYIVTTKDLKGTYKIRKAELEVLRIKTIATTEEPKQSPKQQTLYTKQEFEERKSQEIIKEENKILNAETFKIAKSVKLEKETEVYKKRIIESINKSMNKAIEEYSAEFSINLEELFSPELTEAAKQSLSVYTTKLMESKNFKVNLKGKQICFS